MASVTIKYLKKILYSFFSLQLLNNCPMQNVFFEYLFPQLWHHHNHIIVKRFYACDFRTTSICDMWCGLWLGASWLTSSPEPPPWLRYPRRKLKFQWSFIKPRIPIYVGGHLFLVSVNWMMVKFILWWEMIGFPNYFCEVVSTLLCFRSVFDQFSHLYIHTVCCSIHNIYDIWMKLCWTCFIIHCKCCIWLHNIWRWIFNIFQFLTCFPIFVSELSLFEHLFFSIA